MKEITCRVCKSIFTEDGLILAKGNIVLERDELAKKLKELEEKIEKAKEEDKTIWDIFG